MANPGNSIRGKAASLHVKLQSLKASIDLSGRGATLSARILQEQFTQSLLADSRYASPQCLARSRFQVFSQFGQDGMIAEIFRRIGIHDSRFIEIGVAALESNTTFLLFQGWTGLWVDPFLPSHDELPAGIRNAVDRKQLSVSRAFVGRDDVLKVLKDCAFDSEFDFVSIDIDYNTYHVWREVARLRPRVICVEYNSHIPPEVEWIAPYLPDGTWDYTIVYGASLKSFEIEAGKLGYCLVGCDLAGTDAFFVREDLVADKFLSPFTAQQHFEPPRFFLATPPGHTKGFPVIDQAGAR